jgi:hypothetical protein
MKKLTILLFSILISFNSFGEWKPVVSNVDYKDTFYVDFNRIKILNSTVLWWDLRDGPKPISDKYFSTLAYSEGDCSYFRYKPLSLVFFTNRMGKGEKWNFTPKNKDWRYPSPGSSDEKILKSVCDYVE